MTKKLFIILLFLTTTWVYAQSANATSNPSYTAPDEVVVTMYPLLLGGAPDPNAVPLECISGGSDYRYGCTAYCRTEVSPVGTPCTQSRKEPYPYNSNPVLVSIENDYLLDVVPAETSPSQGFRLTMLKAQAIAARSYAYFFEDNNLDLENHANHQTFIPYQFDRLGYFITFEPAPCEPGLSQLNQFQQTICGAVASRRYISYNWGGSGAELPTFAEYTADVRNRTLDGDPLYPYLLSVDDPISSHPDIILLGHGHGLSQKGASRWEYGNLSFYGSLDPWSVSWGTPEQILVHYYTNINIRMSYNLAVTLPDNRWNPLQIDWGGTSNNGFIQMQPNSSYSISILLQNTGKNDWNCTNEYYLRYRWVKGQSSQLGSTYADVCGATRGDPSLLTYLTINTPLEDGVYSLRFDIYRFDQDGNALRFSDPDANGNYWPTYNKVVCVGDCSGDSVFVPLMAGVNTSQ